MPFPAGIFGNRHGAPDREHSPQSDVSHESAAKQKEEAMNGLIYLIGLIVVILFILSFLGLR
jgi:predicted membrane channel-forming protein YqfA (hemolysin III family)